MHIHPTSQAHLLFRPMPLGSIELDSTGFWGCRQALNRETTLPHGYRMLAETGHFDNFRIVAGAMQGKFKGFNYNDSDVHKWLEAASLELANHPDPALENRIDEVIALLAAAQTADGYLDTYIQLGSTERFSNLDRSHELYVAGHLFEAAVAHHRVTGKTNLLDIALRFADYLVKIFGPGKREAACGHAEVELALVELYRLCGKKAYLDLAMFFTDQRGKGKMKGYEMFGPDYHQDRQTVRKANAVEGHAVRQLYLASGAADLYLETGQADLLQALVRQWEDMTRYKMYLTGGVGSRFYDEAFGDPYELPPRTSYCETCAAIASMMWNWRMLAATGEARYAELIERTLYNGFLSGWSLDGSHFFYVNPLQSAGGVSRQEWYECCCCPPNIMRQAAAVQYYMATSTAGGIQIHQYMSGRVKNEALAKLAVESGMPWDGRVTIQVESSAPSEWELALRIPSWCTNPSIRLNGTLLPAPQPGAYARILRTWKPGDRVEMDLPMQPHFTLPHPYITDVRGCVALERGPLVYCFEEADLPAGADLRDANLSNSAAPLAVFKPDMLGGVTTLQVQGSLADHSSWQGILYQPAAIPDTGSTPLQLTAIPYYAWGNRTPGRMSVWMPV